MLGWTVILKKKKGCKMGVEFVIQRKELSTNISSYLTFEGGAYVV